jgi:DNA polymerase I-like protein with 3'-5' exonuclease and polymerase domains
VHDSLIASVPKEEYEEYLIKATNIMQKRLFNHFDWLLIPIEAEAEVSPLGASWADKKAI